MLSGRHIFVTGGLGFIGSYFVRRCLQSDVARVTVYDCRPLTLRSRLEDISDTRLRIVHANLIDTAALNAQLPGHHLVVHLSANTNMQSGQQQPDQDFFNGFQATYNLLEAMRRADVKDLLFASSSAVYGMLAVRGVSESDGPLLPISTYGAGKLSAEGWISAYCHLFNLHAVIYRFGNVVGAKMDHGIIYDVVGKLLRNSRTIDILGNGMQGRTYILADDCVDAMLFVYDKMREQEHCAVVNISGRGVVTSFEIVRIVQRQLGLDNLTIKHQGTSQGWRGDVPVVALDLSKAQSLGWQPPDSHAAVEQAARWLIEQQRQHISYV